MKQVQMNKVIFLKKNILMFSLIILIFLIDRYSKNFMIETRGPLVDKIKPFAPNGDLHNFDMSLFWGAIRNNIKVRANAFQT